MMNETKLLSILKWVLGVIIGLIATIILTLAYQTIRSVAREASTIEALAPEHGNFVIADGVKIFYQELGPADGKPVILLHGTGSWSEIWRETMTALSANGYRAIAIDIPPFGYSERLEGSELFTTEKQGRRLNAVLKALNIQNGVLVGHSVGGRPTLEALLNNQKGIEKLVLVDVALGFGADSLNPQFAQNEPGFLLKSIFQIKLLRNVLFRSLGTNPSCTRAQLEAFVYNKSAIKPEHIEMLQKPLSIQGTTVSNADWFEYLTIAAPHQGLSTKFDKYGLIKIPTLIIWGNQDDITPLWQGAYLSRLIPNSTLEIMHGVGHIPYIEDASEFNRVLLTFLNKEIQLDNE